MERLELVGPNFQASSVGTSWGLTRGALPDLLLPAASVDRGPKDHINRTTVHSGSIEPKTRGIPEIRVRRILVFMWAFSRLVERCYDLQVAIDTFIHTYIKWLRSLRLELPQP